MIPAPEAYLAALGVSTKRGTRKRQLQAALTRAHDLRRFEIENYWRRATYAWAFQAAALAALAVTIGRPLWATHAATAFGGLAALAAALTARGSKFWQENWEAHVDLLERSSEGRLMEVVFARDRGAWSVSRVNERFLWLLAAGWTSGFVASVMALGHDRLAIGQAGCELLAFAIAAWWLIDARTELNGRRVPLPGGMMILRETIATGRTG